MSKRRWVFIIMAALLLLLTACSSGGQVMDGEDMVRSYTQISQDEAKQMMEQDGTQIIVDVRTQEEYDSGHIPGAICIPNESIGTEQPKELPDLDQVILIYCRSGNRSKQAAQKLFDMGYTNIYEFGGINDWTGEVVTETPDADTSQESEPENPQGTVPAPADTLVGEFDFSAEKVLLNSGWEMPIIGTGTWTLSDEEAENSTYYALKSGMRLIDTARYYQNETGVGKGLARAVEEGIVTREDVFITSKIYGGDHDRAVEVIDEALSDLGVDYIDLMLIHQPGSDDAGVYKAMEEAVESGKLHSIGISNYYTKEQVDEVLSFAEITPAEIQNENHIYYQNAELRDYVKQYGIVMESWYPFGGRGHTQESFENDVILDLAKDHGKTAAQIILRWHLQDGYIAIPGSGNPAAVCVMDSWPSEESMMKLAMENNLSETAFIVKEDNGYHLRWFTPGTEVELCGHATLASSYVILTFCEPESSEVRFNTLSGVLTVRKKGNLYEMDFPTYPLTEIPVTDAMEPMMPIQVNAFLWR